MAGLQHRGCGNMPPAFEPLCGLVARQRDVLAIDDLADDPRFAPASGALGDPAPVFWAGAPLMPLPGTVAGTLMVADSAARPFPPEDRRKLELLARVASEHLRLLLANCQGSKQEALYRVLAENTTDTIVRGNLEGVRLYISPSVQMLLGYTPQDLIGKRAIEIVHPDDADEFRGMLRDVLEGNVEIGVNEHRQRHKDGSWVWLEALVKLTLDEVTGVPDGYVASARNVSQRKEAELRLSHMATHDPLTGLPNRFLLNERLRQEILRFKRTGMGFALLCLDLDSFKPVNDQFGHGMGDALLRATAARLRAAVREEDMVARVGGDEFVIIQTSSCNEPQAAIRLAERLIDAISRPYELSGLPLSIGVSIGIATAHTPFAALDTEGLMKMADQALYRAKAAGKNCYALSAGVDA